MRMIDKYQRLKRLALTLGVLLSPSAQAHLMVAQHGTLNIVDDAVFMVLSLPVSAFTGIDDNGDGKLSMKEFNHYRSVIIKTVTDNVTLSDKTGVQPLEGMMLAPAIAHDIPIEPATQVIVLGRFTWDAAGNAAQFSMKLFGQQPDEQRVEMAVTRRSDGLERVFELTPQSASGALLP